MERARLDGVFMMKLEREREREREVMTHVECRSKGQTTGVLGFVFLCKDIVGAKTIGFYSSMLVLLLTIWTPSSLS